MRTYKHRHIQTQTHTNTNTDTHLPLNEVIQPLDDIPGILSGDGRRAGHCTIKALAAVQLATE